MEPYFIGLHQPQQSSHQHLQVHRGRGHRLHQAIQGHNPKEQGRGHQLQRLRGSNVTTIGRDPDQSGSRVGSQQEKGKATTRLMGMATRVWVLRGHKARSNPKGSQPERANLLLRSKNINKYLPFVFFKQTCSVLLPRA